MYFWQTIHPRSNRAERVNTVVHRFRYFACLLKFFQIGPDFLFNIRRAIELRNRSQAYELTSVVQDVRHFLYVHILGQDDRGSPFVRFGDHDLIYLYECRNCGKRYVGRTGQRLADRIDQHVPKHIITEPKPGKKTRGRSPNERSNPADGYDSAIACHLAGNKTCSRRYEVGGFSVLTRARSKNHLNVSEAVYISVLNPVLCKQKSFVTSLTLFQRTQRTHPP